MSVDARFNSLVSINQETGCHEWTGRLNASGYGSIKRGKNQLAHRIAWTSVHGEIPDGMHVLHKCDNRKCVNVEHLFLGTNADNVKDSTDKKRRSVQRGVLNHNAKVTQEIANKIRELYKPCPTMRDLAKMFGISKTEVGRIIRMEVWNTKQTDEIKEAP